MSHATTSHPYLLEENQLPLQEIQNFCEENQKLCEENQKLCKKNQKLTAHISQLEEQLNTNSSNSSKPPSQDPFRPSKQSPPSEKKQGGQPGHKGHHRQMLPLGTRSVLSINSCACAGPIFLTRKLFMAQRSRQRESGPHTHTLTHTN